MEKEGYFISDLKGLKELQEDLRDGWVPDPVLMPSGRPNVVEGVGAIYHLVKGDDDDIALYVIKASPEMNLAYAKKKMEENEPPKPGEFADDDLTQKLQHGQIPLEGGDWRIHKIYENWVIWIRHAPKEASL